MGCSVRATLDPAFARSYTNFDTLDGSLCATFNGLLHLYDNRR